jgi:alanyl-tRNA synthetase
MESKKIRQIFQDFFKSKEHEIVASAPMVIKDDPTLMFTNAGMNQFKDLFLGNSPVKYPRIANSQKCLRVSGKHNDLEEVGVDTYHHTMFEMLGNWSFGDYFKKDAIAWAWELLTEQYQIDKDRLYITVFGGDEADGLSADEDASDIWRAFVSNERILQCSKKDNFWEMGDTGPCGPCSEIHVDLRSDEERAKVDGKTLVNQDHPQVIEIWNLVFMEFNRSSNGSLTPLPAQHIDTGMGFERLAVVLQGEKSNYDTDIFQPLIKAIEKRSGVSYTGTDSKQDVAIRVISDHVRAVAFSIADGQLPSNSGAGYVIRRILRRAIRYAFSFLNLKEAFIYELVSILDNQMGDAFPELRAQKDLIGKVIHEEEENFLRTLDKGIGMLQAHLKEAKGKVLDGHTVFELYDTFGFPVDLTALIASESGYSIDEVGFQKELQIQKERSRAAGKIEAGDWHVLLEDEREEFVGYDRLEAEVHITRYRKIKAKGKDQYQLVFNLTPFYPEGGGQVGDVGTIEADGKSYEILDTRKENNLILHFCDELPPNLEYAYKAKVNAAERVHSARHHSATHLLHHVLREELGAHVEQKGSLVNSSHLRFDFSHFAKVDDDQLGRIESRVNDLVLRNIPLDERRNVPIKEAGEMGAMMLFGEKYGDVVRVIRFGDSVELCGGTHVEATGNVGPFRIVSEGAVAAGIRRIEAISGSKALEKIHEERALLKEVGQLLKHPGDIQKSVEDLISKNQELNKALEKVEKAKAGDIKGELKGKISELNGIRYLIEKVDLDAAAMKDIAFQLKNEEENLFVVLGAARDGKALLTCMVTEDLVKNKDLKAGDVIRGLSKDIQGGGGGQAFFATAGGKNPDGLDTALKNAISFIS